MKVHDRLSLFSSGFLWFFTWVGVIHTLTKANSSARLHASNKEREKHHQYFFAYRPVSQFYHLRTFEIEHKGLLMTKDPISLWRQAHLHISPWNFNSGTRQVKIVFLVLWAIFLCPLSIPHFIMTKLEWMRYLNECVHHSPWRLGWKYSGAAVAQEVQ